MEPNNYSMHPIDDIILVCAPPEDEEDTFMDENIYRISSQENFIVNLIIFINDEFIEDIFKLKNDKERYDKYIKIENILKS